MFDNFWRDIINNKRCVNNDNSNKFIAITTYNKSTIFDFEGRIMKYKILLVEKENQMTSQLTTTLENLGHFIFSTCFYSDAAYALESNRFDILIIDPMISNENGEHIITLARSVHPHIVTFLLATPENCARILTTVQPYIFGYLYKPYTINQLIQRISQVMSRKHRRQKYNVLAIGAYLGDIEIGCGGSLAMHAYKGDHITLLVLDSERFGHIDECKLTAKLLNASLTLGSEPEQVDMSYSAYMMQLIEKTIQQSKPGIIYTHCQSEGLRKRKDISLTTMLAAQQAPAIYGYFSQSTTIEFRPERFNDISAHIKDKQKLLECYTSQKNTTYFSREMIDANARYWGHYVGNTLVESFELLRG